MRDLGTSLTGFVNLHVSKRMQKMMIELFEKSGHSSHTIRAQTLYVLVNHCRETKQDFTLRVSFKDEFIYMEKTDVRTNEAHADRQVDR